MSENKYFMQNIMLKKICVNKSEIIQSETDLAIKFLLNSMFFCSSEISFRDKVMNKNGIQKTSSARLDQLD